MSEASVRTYTWVVIPLALIASPFWAWTSIPMFWILAAGSLFLPLVCNYYTSPHNDELRSTCAIHVSVTNGAAVALGIASANLVLSLDGSSVTAVELLIVLFVAAPLAGIFFGLISWNVFRLVTLFTDTILNRLRRIPDWFECQECGYDLTGNVSGRCPECGTPTAS